MIISKSTKQRQGVRRINQNGNVHKEYDKFPRQWHEVVTKVPAGEKTVKGKPAYRSYTSHVPA